MVEAGSYVNFTLYMFEVLIVAVPAGLMAVMLSIYTRNKKEKKQ